MASTQNPFGLHTVTPYLVVPNVRELITFLVEIFGATQRGKVHLREDDSVKHTEIVIGDSVIMLGEPIDCAQTKPSTLYVYVEDCDQTYRRAIKAGAKPIMPPADFPHGDRYGGFADLSGNAWFAVTHTGKALD